MQVPAFDATRQYQGIKSEVDSAVSKVLTSGHFILGENVADFEREMAAYCGAGYAIGVANGSDALHLALLALGVGPGDEVIVPGFTFFATAGAVARAGATPVFADIDPDSYNLDPQSFARAITPRTKAVIPVHLYGNPADLGQILDIARQHNVKVIEDGAQSIGAEYRGRRIGALADIGTLSFFPTKNLGAAGDAGMVLTNDPELHERIRMLRAHGARQKYYHEELGYNSRLDELQAAILRVKMRYLDDWNERRREIAQLYSEGLKGTRLVLPKENSEGKHVFHQYTIRVSNRTPLEQYLKNSGVGCTVYYPTPLHKQPVFGPIGNHHLPISEASCETVLSLPMFPELTQTEIDFVLQKFVHYFEGEGSAS